MPSSSPASSPVSRWRLYCSNASSKRDTKTSHSIAVRRIRCPPEQATNMADNSRATKGGQMTRYRQPPRLRFADVSRDRYIAVMSPAVKTILERVASWPAEDQEELSEVAREIEARRGGIYRLSDEERAAIDAARRGLLASDDEVEAFWKR